MRFALVDDAGAVVKSGQQDVAQAVANDDYFTTFAIPVVHGQYRLRVAVADRDGHIGAIEQAVAAELNHVGSWLASDLLLSWTAADESSRFLGLEILPKTATHLRVSLELYPTATASLDSVSVRLQILQAGSPVPAMEHDLTAADRGGWLAVTGDVPVSAFPPGVYAIRAIVLQGGNAVRTVSGSFRKQE
jgi:hypothetical protein